MSLKTFLTTQFVYAKPHYSIHSLYDIQRVLFLDNDLGTVYQGSQAMHVGFSKMPPYTSVYYWLADQIHSYLNNGVTETQVSFDAWHKTVCEGFISRCAAIGASVEYGFAQKNLNLAIKYCYCFGDADEAVPFNKFKFAHVALDGFTFCPSSSGRGWNSYLRYFRISRSGLQLPFYTEVVNPLVNIKTLSAWSKLNYEEYISVQNEMREYFAKNPILYSDIAHLDPHHLAGCHGSTVLTPFQSEFFLWG